MKCNQVIKDEKGQLSIFLGIALLVVITMLAFVINVGLFVKAKINLQNAVDSAAYAGAATQARQLSNIAYLNWELRNTYKEWMYKYYVLGTMALKETEAPKGENVNFRQIPFFERGSAEDTGKSFDPFNAPSICIHFGSPHNICEIYDVPGLPRFQTVGLPSISPHHESLLNTLTNIKANNCSLRSDINFGVAMIWAYGTGSNLFQDRPQIAASRVGAWPQALELGMRIRNMEMIVNRPAIDSTPLCINGDDGGCLSVEQLGNQLAGTPFNERPIKAFMSAYRNLGGGTIKSGNEGAGPNNQDTLSASFKLYELPPKPIDATGTLGEVLIPPNVTIGNTSVKATLKQYLDLYAWPINFSTFYTTFVSNNQAAFANTGVTAEGGCAGTKTALPVPGYLFGFSKNPESLTYYAVKGEAKYVGLMFPFTEKQGITLQAYAAAKPFGGRIGPVLFANEGNKAVKVRPDKIGRSAPYLSVFDPGSAGKPFEPGFPIPFKNDFFASKTDAVGGEPGASEEAKFVIPNLLYDAINLEKQKGVGADSILVIQKANSLNQAYGAVPEKFGLYDKAQYVKFRSNHISSSAINMSEREIQQSIEQVRAPTVYEAMNYMIPISFANGRDQINSVQTVNPSPAAGASDSGAIQYNLYAPLFGDLSLYGQNAAAIEAIVNGYIENSSNAVDKYLDALASVAESMMTQSSATRGGADTYFDAANSIHDVGSNGKRKALTDPNTSDCTKVSLATKFRFFFKGNQEDVCGITPLKTLFTRYLSNNIGVGNFSTHYQSTYMPPAEISNSNLASAYFPGRRQGANDNGNWVHPFTKQASEFVYKRNYYSTKFVPISKLTGTEFPYWGKGLIQEGGSLSEQEEDVNSNKGGANTLDASLLEDFGNLLTH